MGRELRRAIETILTHFAGTYNRHRYVLGGMPLAKAVKLVESEMRDDKEDLWYESW